MATAHQVRDRLWYMMAVATAEQEYRNLCFHLEQNDSPFAGCRLLPAAHDELLAKIDPAQQRIQAAKAELACWEQQRESESRPRKGPKKGSGAYAQADRNLFSALEVEMRAGKTRYAAARALADKGLIAGRGSIESRARRLEKLHAKERPGKLAPIRSN